MKIIFLWKILYFPKQIQWDSWHYFPIFAHLISIWCPWRQLDSCVFYACSLLHYHPAYSVWKTPLYTREEMNMKKAKNVASWKPDWCRRSSWQSVREHPWSWRAPGELLRPSFRKCSNHLLSDPFLKLAPRSKWCVHSVVEEEPEIPTGWPFSTVQVPHD